MTDLTIQWINAYIVGIDLNLGKIATFTTATTTTVVGSPAASTQRNVKHLSITNNHATVSCNVAVEHTDGTNAVELRSVVLLAGENLTLDGNGNWRHYDFNGAEYLPSSGSKWTFLGRTELGAAAIRTGTVSWPGAYAQLWFEYMITGYSGSAIGRLIVGPAAGLSETATLFCTSLIEGVTLTTTSVSVPGWPTAVTSANVARFGHMYVSNVAAVVKRMTGHGQHSGTAPTTVPAQMRMEGMWNNTNALINCAELASYVAITGAAIAAVTLSAGTFLSVWGRNND